jgi:hypothetical protein
LAPYLYIEDISMTKLSLARPNEIRVKRSDLRGNQKQMLSKVKGSTVLVVPGSEQGDEKLVMDRKYFDEVLHKMRAAMETAEIAMDRRLFAQILRAAPTLGADMRQGKLHSVDEAFGED